MTHEQFFFGARIAPAAALRPVTPVKAARAVQLSAAYRLAARNASDATMSAVAQIEALPALSRSDVVLLFAALVDECQESDLAAETRDACDAMDAAALVLGGAA